MGEKKARRKTGCWGVRRRNGVALRHTTVGSLSLCAEVRPLGRSRRAVFSVMHVRMRMHYIA